MIKARALSFAVAAVALASYGRSALAQENTMPAAGAGHAQGVGVGVTQLLSATGGTPPALNFVFDGGRWHADALFGAADTNDVTRFLLAGRGWFHVHSTAAADFSLGGGLGFTHVEVPGPLDDLAVLHIEAGMMIRWFATSNLALTAFGGIGLLASDGDGFLFGGQLASGLGINYFFF
jgi:hypothetical protein